MSDQSNAYRRGYVSGWNDAVLKLAGAFRRSDKGFGVGTYVADRIDEARVAPAPPRSSDTDTADGR